MGHTIVARLPRTARWQAVVSLLRMPDLRADHVAGATSKAARKRLRQLRTDPSLAHCFWLLVRLAAAAREDDFLGEVGRLGIPAQAGQPAVGPAAAAGAQPPAAGDRYRV